MLRKPLHEEITRITPAESRTQNTDAFWFHVSTLIVTETTP
nr:MAG TPA: hypothetical protein [Caudoviricetes sp.]